MKKNKIKTLNKNESFTFERNYGCKLDVYKVIDPV